MHRSLLLLLGLALTWLVVPACGDPPPVPRAGPLDLALYDLDEDDRPDPGQFLRYAVPGPRGGGLDIAITDYEHPEGLAPVSLVGVVHVADAPYFERIQALLDDYGLVLYEAVKPAEEEVGAWQDDARERMRALDGFQRQLVSWFGFVYQLDALDYRRDHFVHADMSLEEFTEQGGDKFLAQLGMQGAEATSEDDASGDTDSDTEIHTESDSDGDSEDAIDTEPAVGGVGGGLPETVRGTLASVRAFGELALGTPNPLRSLARKMFAHTMGTTDIGDTLDMIPGLTELLLTKRNEVAMAKFSETMPDAVGRIAIFYGAAHMADLEERLEARGYVRTTGRWLRAWALRAPLPR